MFETRVVRANVLIMPPTSPSHNFRNIFSVSFNMKVCCVFSLESPHQGDSYEYTQYTIFNIKKKITQIILNLQLWDFSKELKNGLENALVNKASEFEPLKFYCISTSKFAGLLYSCALGIGRDNY